MLQESNILIVKVSANCTDCLQPMDLSVNKAAKEFKQLDKGTEEHTPVDLKMSIMKPLGARWLVSLHDYLQENDSIIKNGFKAAGVVNFYSMVQC